jgi:hypothetical protein
LGGAVVFVDGQRNSDYPRGIRFPQFRGSGQGGVIKNIPVVCDIVFALIIMRGDAVMFGQYFSRGMLKEGLVEDLARSGGLSALEFSNSKVSVYNGRV